MRKPTYSMIIQWSDEDAAYVVTLPEFPGCRTHGESYVDAARMGAEALELLLESDVDSACPLPLPLTLRATGDQWNPFEKVNARQVAGR